MVHEECLVWHLQVLEVLVDINVGVQNDKEPGLDLVPRQNAEVEGAGAQVNHQETVPEGHPLPEMVSEAVANEMPAPILEVMRTAFLLEQKRVEVNLA